MSGTRADAEERRRALMAEIERVLALLDSHPPACPDDRAAIGTVEVGCEQADNRLAALAETLRLSAFERDILVLCVAAEVDPRAAARCEELCGRPYPTFALALGAFRDPHWGAITPSGPLRNWQIVEVVSDGAPLTERRLRADERVLHHLTGVDYLDPRLAAVVRPVTAPPAGDAALVAELRSALASGPVVLAGDDHAAKRAAARTLAIESRRPLLALASEDIPATATERATLARLWEREAAFTGAILLVDCDEVPAAAGAFAEEIRAPLVLLSREPLAALTRAHARLTVNRPKWHVAGGRTPADAAAGVRLGELAQRIEPRATWEDIVLPAYLLQTLREVGLHLRHADLVYGRWGLASKSARGLGISALFAGPSGTGKTMAAEVLANDLGLDLYRVDLSTVVSKYVGETEKNLRRVFDAAEESGVVLLFDEADALFGKRSEVRDSHDRYANIEVSYLLQRMESYAGLAILTTNMRQALDPAFLRRLRFVVQFPFPDARQRAEIWTRVFPRQLPRQALDVQRLSQLNVAGGNIRNIAVNAAFLAAADGGTVTMGHLLQATHGEYAKLEKPLSEAETRGWA